MSNQIQRYLKTEELYDAIIVLIPEHTIDRISETAIRGILDAILTQGKIEGRLLSHTVHGFPVSPHGDRLIEAWQRIVDSA